MHRILKSLIITALWGSLLLHAQCDFPKPTSAPLLTYVFEPIFSNDKLALRITLEFWGNRGGREKLEIPSEYNGLRDLQTAITELQPLSVGTKLIDTKNNGQKIVEFRPRSHVRISYLLTKNWNGPLDARTRFLPDLNPDYFHIIGPTSLIYPAIDDLLTVDAHFDWQKLPPWWSLATSFGTENRCQSFHGLLRDAVNSLFVGGDYRIATRQMVGSNILAFAIRGKWDFTDAEWIDAVEKVTSYERSFWHDNKFPYFLVTLTPLTQEHGSSGGTGLTNSFMEHLSRLDSLTPVIFGQLAHETFHTWNPGKIGYIPGSDYPVSWFFEGFTVYYQNLMLLRAGLEQVPDYVAAINTEMRDYELNEGRDVPLTEFIRRHSADHSVLNQLDYRRGAVLGLWLDATIRNEGRNKRSLDDFMFNLMKQNEDYEQHHRGRPLALTNDRIIRLASKYFNSESVAQFRRYVENGGTIRVPQQALGPCVESYTEQIPKFDLGFDRNSTDTKAVSGVKTESEAFKAGLRNGQSLSGWSIYWDDTAKPIRLKIKSQDGVRTIEYYPVGPKTPVQQFTLLKDKFASDKSGCEDSVQRH